MQRVSQVAEDDGRLIKQMTNEQLVELELDPTNNLEKNTIRIVDIRGEQYGVGAGKLEYCGIFPVIVSAPMAIYY